MSRIEALRERLTDRLLVTDLVNVLYLTGFDSSNAALLVDPDGTTRLYTDFRYLEAAQAVPDVEAVQTRRAVIRDLAERLSGRIVFVPADGTVEELRAVKDDDELDRIRRAALAADRAFEALTAEAWAGRSERELAWRLHQLLHAHGADTIAFDPLIAAGPNGSKPHTDATDRIVPERTLVVADWGAKLDGYCSDCTRTPATGDLPRELRRAYDACLEAQLAAVDGIRPGMTGAAHLLPEGAHLRQLRRRVPTPTGRGGAVHPRSR